MQKQLLLYFILFVILTSFVILILSSNSQTLEFEDDIEQPIVELIETENTNQTEIEKETGKEKDLVDFAKKHLGTKYKAAGKTPEGFDCSGFVGFVFKHFGITLPASSREMAKIGDSIQMHDLKAGDLVFFEGSTQNKIVGHVGIVCEVDENNIYFIHASVSSNVVISRMKEDYYSKRFLSAKRIL